jgi:hypothetical protein
MQNLDKNPLLKKLAEMDKLFEDPKKYSEKFIKKKKKKKKRFKLF